MKRLFGLMVVLLAAGLLAVGCGGDKGAKKAPVYPACNTDEDCAEKGEFCVNKQCVECAKASHCKGPCQDCKDNKCVRKENCCTGPKDCPPGLKCLIKPGKKEGTCGTL